MKLRPREINIFSMSALDLFASALGAFMLLAIMALPFFPNTGDSPQLAAEAMAKLEEAREKLRDARNAAESNEQQLQQCQSQLSDAESSLQACEAVAQLTFVLVVISWSKTDDVDLHVIDPIGNEYYWKKRRFPGSDAALEEDNIRGPGNEIWLSPRARQGRYQVCINLYRRDNRFVKVRGLILHQSGKEPLPLTTLNRQRQKILVAEFDVGDAGSVTVRRAQGNCPSR